MGDSGVLGGFEVEELVLSEEPAGTDFIDFDFEGAGMKAFLDLLDAPVGLGVFGE